MASDADRLLARCENVTYAANRIQVYHEMAREIPGEWWTQLSACIADARKVIAQLYEA